MIRLRQPCPRTPPASGAGHDRALALAAAAAVAAALLSPYIPSDLAAQIGDDAVDNIPGIIAASTLTVTTFSLTTPVGAHSAATSNVTPRATTLMMEDATTRTMLTTFTGSFLFGLVGIIALSAGTNELGTAIDIVGRMVRVLAALAEPREAEREIAHTAVLVPPLDLADLFDDLFIPIARDGATRMEIGVRRQKALLTLSRLDAPGFAEEARRHAAEALERFEAGLRLEADERKVREAASWLGRGGAGRVSRGG